MAPSRAAHVEGLPVGKNPLGQPKVAKSQLLGIIVELCIVMANRVWNQTWVLITSI